MFLCMEQTKCPKNVLFNSDISYKWGTESERKKKVISSSSSGSKRQSRNSNPGLPDSKVHTHA